MVKVLENIPHKVNKAALKREAKAKEEEEGIEAPKKIRIMTEEQKEKGRQNLAKGRETLRKKQEEKRLANEKVKNELILKKAEQLKGLPQRNKERIKKELGMTNEDSDNEIEEQPQKVVIIKKKKPSKKVIIYESESDEEEPQPQIIKRRSQQPPPEQPQQPQQQSQPQPIKIQAGYGFLKFI